MRLNRRTTLLALGAILALGVAAYWSLGAYGPSRGEPPRVESIARAGHEESRLLGNARSVAPRPAPTQAPYPSDGPAEVTLRVLDLATELPPDGIVLEVGTAEGVPQRVPVSAGGFFTIPESRVSSLQASSSGWTLVVPRPSENQGSSTVWAYRPLHLSIHLEALSATSERRAFDPTQATVTVQSVTPPDASMERPAPDPWNVTWLRMHRLHRLVRHARVNARGNCSVRVPNLRWMLVRATAPGWRSEPVDVPAGLERGQETVEVTLGMRPTPIIRGRVVSEDGQPIPDARVDLYVFVRSTRGQLNLLREMVPGTGTIVQGKPDGSAWLRTRVSARADPNGQFSIDAPTGGEGLLVACAEGHVPRRVELGALQADVAEDIAMASPDNPGERVCIEWKGEPLAGCNVHITDVTAPDSQYTMGFQLDAHGTMSADALEPGRLYALHVLATAAKPDLSGEDLFGFLKWESPGIVELSTLCSNLTQFLTAVH
jgi:hypothetical protein